MRSAGSCRPFGTVREKTRAIGRLFALSHKIPANLRLQEFDAESMQRKAMNAW